MHSQCTALFLLSLLLLSACGSPAVSAPAPPTPNAVQVAAYLTAIATPRATATPAAAALPDRPLTCADSLIAVKAYHAPGDPLSVEEHVARSLAAERRPVQGEGWMAPGTICLAGFKATIGNEPQAFLWRFDPATGRVEATNAETQRISGW